MDIELIRILHATQELSNALSVAHGTILVTHEKGAKTSDFVMQLTNLLVERLILGRVHFNLGLKVGKPLLLSLSTFESGNTMGH